MSIHHHHTFQFDEDDQPIYFDGVLVHDHDDANHSDRSLYFAAHEPLSGYIDDSICLDDDSGFDCPWLEMFS